MPPNNLAVAADWPTSWDRSWAVLAATLRATLKAAVAALPTSSAKCCKAMDLLLAMPKVAAASATYWASLNGKLRLRPAPLKAQGQLLALVAD